jgi:3-hydroxy acid dehydrogenase / malonic semialdehyde reductase
MNKVVLITGATSGIGRSCAELFAKNKYDVIITGRREERLQKLKEEIENEYGVKVFSLCFDVRDKDSVHQSISSLPAEWKNIDVLINNAGLSLGLSPVHEGNIDDWETMIDTNVKGLLYVSKEVMSLMIERRQGYIINLGSIAGKETYLNGNVYCASKHAVDSLTKAMRMDLLPYGIRVSAIHPGAVETEFSVVRFKGDEARAKKVYEGFQPLTPDDIADSIYFMASRPAHVNINEMIIMPAAQATASLINRNT